MPETIKKRPIPVKVIGRFKEQKNMPKVSKQSHFIKSFEHLLAGKLTAREVLIFGIVHQFEVNGVPCFISRQDLAKRINESEATAERSLQLLIKEGYILSRREGRKRYLFTSYPQKHDLYQLDTHQPTDLYQKEGQSVSKQGGDLYQLDTLTRSITRSINETKELDLVNNKSKNSYILEWNEEKKTMVRRKAD